MSELEPLAGTAPASHPAPGLLSATPAAWAEAASRQVVLLLSDHAHCELKAAASAMTILKRNPDRPRLARRLAPLIREESDHLHLVLRALHREGARLGHDAPNPYAEGLHRHAQDSRGEGSGYLDALIVSTLIERRSHERFRLLAECAFLERLRPLYDLLIAAEERHGDLYWELALEAFPRAVATRRFETLARRERDLLAELPFDYRVHSGLQDVPVL